HMRHDWPHQAAWSLFPPSPATGHACGFRSIYLPLSESEEDPENIKPRARTAIAVIIRRLLASIVKGQIPLFLHDPGPVLRTIPHWNPPNQRSINSDCTSTSGFEPR